MRALPLIFESALLVVIGVGFLGLGSLNQASQERWRAVLLVLMGVVGVALCATVILEQGTAGG